MRRITIEKDGLDAALDAVRRSLPDDDDALVVTVRDILRQVRERGDEALTELGRRFDAPGLAAIEVTPEEWDRGCGMVPEAVRGALDRAYASIVAFHEPQRRMTWMTMGDGRTMGQLIRPLDRVGVYVPGGRAEYPSSVLMAAGPASVAGVPDIRLCTPARRDGSVPPTVLYAARLAGVRAIYRVGGAQAVAAMAYGTRTIPRVDKIVGPGNAYVCAAKKLLWGMVDMDMLAGPSEVCVVADATADPRYVAADMLSQAEHDPQCAAFLIATDESIADRVQAELDRQIRTLERRDTPAAALAAHGAIIVAGNLDEALYVANACAPEHLALMVADPMAAVAGVRHAGAVILGNMTPQTVGDYMAGPSHVLPTGGTARFWSPLHVDSFVKKTSFLGYDAAALGAIADDLVRLAEAEGFGAHAAAVTIRMDPGLSG